MLCIAGMTAFRAVAAANEAWKLTVPNTMYDHPEPVNLPELMKTADGQSVSTVEKWERIRRPEILRFFTENMLGVRPVERPADLKFERLEKDRTLLSGKVVRKRVKASFSGPYASASFNFAAFIPATATPSSPAPAFILFCNRALEKLVDLDLENPSGFFPVEKLADRGYAIIVFRNTAIANDGYSPKYGEVGTAMFQDPDFTDLADGVYACWAPKRTQTSWSAISAWAWGMSRIMDWVETEPTLNKGRIAVVGHSRGGKTALWAAASDTRFAMACVNNSGCCGAKLNHAAVSLSETIQQDNNNNPNWFCREFRKFNGRDAYLPFDQHWMAALVAPRLLYIASAAYDYASGPWGEFLTARHASPAWELYGCRGLVEDHPYRIASPFHVGSIGYHLRDGVHDLNLYDWNCYMDFADRHGWRSR